MKLFESLLVSDHKKRKSQSFEGLKVKKKDYLLGWGFFDMFLLFKLEC